MSIQDWIRQEKEKQDRRVKLTRQEQERMERKLEKEEAAREYAFRLSHQAQRLQRAR